MRAGSDALARLLRFAAIHVPFWGVGRAVLERAAEGDRRAWASLPVIAGRDLERSDLVADDLPPDDTATDDPAWTGIGTPLAGRWSEAWIAGDKAEWERLLLERRFPHRREAVAILPRKVLKPGDGKDHLLSWSDETLGGRCRRLPDHFPPAVLLDLLSDEAPHVLFTDGWTLRGMLDVASPGRVRLEHVLAYTPVPDPGAGRRCRNVFGAELIEVLTSPLAGFVAARLSDGVYRTAPETQFTEIVRPDGQPCAPGETGRLVTTPLRSFRRPLIRLDLGLDAKLVDPEAGLFALTS